MPEDLHCHTRVNVEVCQQRGAGSASVADGDPRNAGGGAAAIPVAVEVSRLDRRAELCGEQQLEPVPQWASLDAVPFGVEMTLPKSHRADRRHWQPCVSTVIGFSVPLLPTVTGRCVPCQVRR